MIAMIAMAARFEKSLPRFQGQDCDPGDEIAIAAALYLSRRGDRDRGEVIAIISAMIVIAKNRMCDLRVMIAILSMKSRSQRL